MTNGRGAGLRNPTPRRLLKPASGELELEAVIRSREVSVQTA